MTTHALILAVLTCLAKPSPEALACIDANPALRAQAERIAAGADIIAPGNAPGVIVRHHLRQE